MGRKHCLILFLNLNLAFLLSCANPVMPTGGPADNRPPTLLKSNPDSFALNVTSGSITLTFDEWIDLKNADREVQVSPPQMSPPQISIRGKSVVLSLQDSLKANTTYQINFGSAIRDITEGNVSNRLTLVFSTGSALDSAYMERILVDAGTGMPLSNAVLLAYSNTLDENEHTTAPDFLAHTDSLGLAKLRYLPNKPLHLMGLKESSADYRYNRPSAEWLGFEKEASAPFSFDTLWMFKEEPDSCYFTSVKEAHAGKWIFKLSRPSANITFVQPVEDLNRFVFQKQAGHVDSFFVWISDFTVTDSLNFHFIIDGQSLNRMVYPSGRTRPPKIGLPSLDIPTGTLWPLKFDRPILNFNPQGIHCIQGADTLPAEVKQTEGTLFLDIKHKQQGQIRICWDSAAIFDVFSLPLAAGQLILEPANFVEWTVDFAGNPSDADFLVWAQADGKPERNFEFSIQEGGRKAKAVLPVGRYRLFKTQDINKDGRWTPGRWKGRVHPETTRATTQIFELKAGFDLQTIWE
jgi:hypothetical protein